MPDKPAAKPEKRLPRGRPPKLTPELQKTVIGILTQCGTIEDACYVAGIREQTLYTWKQRGREQAKGVYRDFVDALEAAIVKRRIAREMSVLRAGQKDWRATLAIMALTEPGRYSPRVRITIESELKNVIDRIEAQFGGEPDLCDRILNCIAGGHGGAAIGAAPDGEAGGAVDSSDGGGQALLIAATEPPTGSVPPA